MRGRRAQGGLCALENGWRSRPWNHKGCSMSVSLGRPLVLDPHGSADPCAHCDARALSVCNAIPEPDMARLAAAAVVMEAHSGHSFIEEGQPASSFFNVTRG